MCPSATVQTARQIDVEVVNLSQELCTEYKISSLIGKIQDTIAGGSTVFGADSPSKID